MAGCEKLYDGRYDMGEWFKQTIQDSFNFIVYCYSYRQTLNVSPTSVGNEFVDDSDVVGSSPLGPAPTTPLFPTQHLASLDWAKTTARRDETHLSFGIRWGLY